MVEAADRITSPPGRIETLKEQLAAAEALAEKEAADFAERAAQRAADLAAEQTRTEKAIEAFFGSGESPGHGGGGGGLVIDGEKVIKLRGELAADLVAADGGLVIDGEKVMKPRELLGLSQTDLARPADISQAIVAAIEAGLQNARRGPCRVSPTRSMSLRLS